MVSDILCVTEWLSHLSTVNSLSLSICISQAWPETSHVGIQAMAYTIHVWSGLFL